VRAPLDTNVLVRHFTGQPAGQARHATAFLRESLPASLLLTDVHLSELVFVLESSLYATPRETVAAIIDSVLGLPAIAVDHEERLRQALALYRERAMDWADAYLIATAISSHADEVISFDRFDPKIEGLSVRRVEPRD
jgi:predicted nucleic-acid-binding protein